MTAACRNTSRNTRGGDSDRSTECQRQLPGRGLGPRRRGRDGLRAHDRRRTRRRPVSRGVARRGARLLHPALRRAGVRGGPPRAARPRRGALARRGAPVGEEGPRPGHRRQRGRRPRRADGPARRARAGARAAARDTPGRAREEGRGVARTQGADRGRGREARPGPRLAPRRQPAPRPARRVEGASPAGPGDRRRVVAPLLVRAHVVHEGAQGALRRAGREARRRQAGQAAADQGGGGARDVHGVGSDRRQVPRADAAVEGGRPRRQGRRRRAVEALPWRPGPVLRCPRGSQHPAGRGVRRQPR